MRTSAVPRGAVLLLAALIIAAPAGLSLADGPFRLTSGGLVKHRHTASYPVDNAIGDNDVALKHAVNQAREQWQDKLDSVLGATEDHVTVPSDTAAGVAGVVKFRRYNFADSNAAVMWDAPYHPSPTDPNQTPTEVAFDADRTSGWPQSKKRGNSCKALGHILGLDTAGNVRDDCMEDPVQYDIVKAASIDIVDGFYGPNVEVSGSMFDNRDNLKGTRSYTFTASGVGHAMKSVKVYLDGATSPIVQDDQAPCAEKCTRTAELTREGSELGDGEHTLKVVAENEFGQKDEKTYTVFVEAHTGIMRQYSFESQPLYDRMDLRVNVVNGNLVLANRDLQVAGTTLDLGVSRYYNSLTARKTGFGKGWAMDTAEGVEVKELSDGDVRFFGPTGYAVRFNKQSGSGYDTPTGLDASLKKTADGFELDLLRSQELYKFNSAGRFTEHRNKKSDQKLEFIYSGTQLEKIRDTQERDIDFTYWPTGSGAASGQIKQMSDPTNRTWNYTYNSQGLLSQAWVEPTRQAVTDPTPSALGHVQYGYDAQERLTQITDPNANVVQIAYDGSTPKVASVTRAASSVETDAGSVGYKTSFEYQNTAPGNCIPPNATQEQQDREATVVTAPNGNETSDANDWRTTYCHDEKSRVRRTLDALGRIQQTEWTSQSNVQSYATASGAATSFKYEDQANQGRLTRASAPGGAAATLDYAGAAATSLNPTAVTDPQGTATAASGDHTTTFDYTGDGNTGNLESISSSEFGEVVKLEYFDPLGAGDDPDWKGLLKASIIRNGGTGDTGDQHTEYRYDGAGNLIEELPPKSPSGAALQGSTKYEYDPLSRVKKVVDGNDVPRTVTYDLLDRPLEVRYPAEQGKPDENAVCRTYDENGNVLERLDGCDNSGHSTQKDFYIYNPRNLRLDENLRDSRQNRYRYDANGNLDTLEYVSPNAGIVDYGYNQVNLVTSVAEPLPRLGITQFDYDDDYQLKELRYPNGVVQRNTYVRTRDKQDPNNESKVQPSYLIDTLKVWAAGTDPNTASPDVASLDYDYDGQPGSDYQQDQNSLRRQVIDRLVNVTTDYTYDDLNRLKTADNAGASYSKDFAYTYDKASNTTRAVEGATTTDYGYNRVNELAKINGQDLPDSSTYDANGNLKQLQGDAYRYDNRNRTVGITPSGQAELDFSYVGESQAERLAKEGIKYTDTLLGLTVEDDSATDETLYTRSDTGSPLGQATSRTSTGGDRYFVADSLGSTIALTGPDGKREARYRYEPYGELDQELVDPGKSPPAIPVLFGGQYLDRESGLYKQGQRYYDPALGRWTQKDPLNLFQDPRQANRFAYAGADPVNNVDPSGSISCPVSTPFATYDPCAQLSEAIGGAVDEVVEESGQAVRGCLPTAAGAYAATGGPIPLPFPPYILGRGAVAGGACGVGGVESAARLP